MTPRASLARLAALLAAAALSACTSTSASPPGALFNQPSALAAFRGVTPKSGREPTGPFPYLPYFAVANAGSNDLSIIDAGDDTVVKAPILLRGVVYSVPGRPVLLVSGDLGDEKPDLLAVVTAGDLPWLGGSRVEVVRTWRGDGGLATLADGVTTAEVELGADILDLVALPFDPAAPGSVTLVAALAGDRIAKVTFRRSTAGDGTAIDAGAAQATVATSAPLGFLPLKLAVIPGERHRVFAATVDAMGGVHGVAQIDVAGPAPTFAVTPLDARAPTRLVAAFRLQETNPTATVVDASAFAGQPPVNRVYAILDESGCGPDAEIACGLVALDPDAAPVAGRGSLLADPTPAGTLQAPFLAPIPVFHALALGVTGPPAHGPPDEPQYAGTIMRVPLTMGTRATTAVAGVAASDGALTFVDLARWDVPSQLPIAPNVKASVSSLRPAGTAGAQWLTLFDPASGTTLTHSSTPTPTAAVTVTAGYTPNDRWTVVRQGILPGLASRRAEAGNDGSPWLALQATSAATGFVSQVVRLWDPTLGVHEGDIVVVDPTGLGTCKTFEAEVAALAEPTATRPGGFVRLRHRTPANPAWDACLDAMTTGPTGPAGAVLLATVRAADYVLLRGVGDAAVHVGRPALGQRFAVSWTSETALTSGADGCVLPPAARWSSTLATCSAACRLSCEALQAARLARRIGHVWEAPGPNPAGPALAFTLASEQPALDVPRDFVLHLDTAEGRAPFRVGVSTGSATDPRAVIPYDRSFWGGLKDGPRLLVPFGGGVVLDATPTVQGGYANTIH